MKSLLALGACLCSMACGGGGITDINPIQPIIAAKSIQVTPESISIWVGDVVRLSAVIKDGEGRIITKQVGWSSSDETSVKVSSTGEATCSLGGNATVTANVDGVTANAIVFCKVPAPVFDFSDASLEDQNSIRAGLGLAEEYFQFAFKRGVTRKALSVQTFSSTNADATADATDSKIRVFTLSDGWRTSSALSREKILVHEPFHVFQFSSKMWFSRPLQPVWMTEGSAEYVAMRAIDWKGLFPYSTTHSCMVWNILTSLSPLPLLKETNEPQEVFYKLPGTTYALATLGIEYLVEKKGVGSLKEFADYPSTDWRVAFQAVWGLTPDEFYKSFESWRGSLPQPAKYECSAFRKNSSIQAVMAMDRVVFEK